MQLIKQGSNQLKLPIMLDLSNAPYNDKKTPTKFKAANNQQLPKHNIKQNSRE